jgi:signal peptidase
MRFDLPRDWLRLFSLLVLIYILSNFVYPHLFDNFSAVYVIQPLTWVALSLYVWLRLPRFFGCGKMRFRNTLVYLAFGIAAFQIYLKVVAGLLDQFGKNPSSLTFLGITINIIFVGASLVGMELSRAWLINRVVRRPSNLLPFFMALFFTLLELQFSQIWIVNGTMEEIVKFFGSTFLPLFMENILASYLAMWEGPLPALAYRGLMDAFTWFSPVLPNLNWAMNALTGTVVPLIGLAIINEYVAYKLDPIRFKRRSGEGLVGWIGLCIGGILVLWFALGVFPVMPTVIFSGSMTPGIQVGDVVIIARINTSLLKDGDIAAYRNPDMDVPTVHRIVDIERDDGQAEYIFKGDANQLPDEKPVQPQQIVGKAVLVVPKIGWFTIFLKNLFSGK